MKIYNQLLVAVMLVVCSPAQAMLETKTQHAEAQVAPQKFADEATFRRYKLEIREKLGSLKTWAERKPVIKKALVHGVHPLFMSYVLDHRLTAMTPLADAVLNDDAEMVELLLKKGADAKAEDKTVNPFGRSLLFSAKSEKIFELLLRHGADVNAHERNGQSVLCHVVASDHLSGACVRLCQQHNIDTSKIHCDCSPLHNLVIYKPSIEKLRELLALGFSLRDTAKNSDFKGLTFVEAIKLKTRRRDEFKKFLKDIEQVAQERQLVIKTDLVPFMPAGVAGIVLGYYEKEDFSQTKEALDEVERQLKIRQELAQL